MGKLVLVTMVKAEQAGNKHGIIRVVQKRHARAMQCCLVCSDKVLTREIPTGSQDMFQVVASTVRAK